MTEQHAVNADTDTDHSAPQIDPMQSPGAWLKAERIRQGKSIQQVADGLRLRPHQIESLESDDHSRLPGQTFVRGFIRNYARELNVDSAILLGTPLAHTHVQSPSVVAASVDLRGGLSGTSKTIEPQSQNIPFVASGDPARGSSKALVILGVVIVAAAAAGYWWFKLRPDAATEPAQSSATSMSQSNAATSASAATSAADSRLGAPSPSASLPASAPAQLSTAGVDATVTASIAASAPVGAPALPSSEQTSAQLAASTAAALAAQKLASTAPGAAAPTPTHTAAAPQNLSTPPAPAATNSAMPVSAPPSVPTTGAGRLAFTFSDDAWVQIRGPRGRVIHEKLHTKASRFEFNGQGKLGITIGNAKGVGLTQNGTAIDLAKFTNVTTARLTLDP